MKISLDSFQKIFGKNFWQALNGTIVPYVEPTPNKKEFLTKLHKRIFDFSYSPSRPREYIYHYKDGGAIRFVPTFEREDYCTYFFCVKMIESEIAVNRVPNTFGGWALGNEIRVKEEEEFCEVDYAPPNSLDKFAYTKHWLTFQDVIKRAKEKMDWSHCISFDIANFYDNVNLTALERKLRHAVSGKKQDIVCLLMQFLNNWNREVEGYSTKSMGLPQDEIGDCSRLLANYYLQDHDEYMKRKAEEYDCLYTRYADDQIVFAKSEDTAKLMVFEASMSLFKLNLNLNASKIIHHNSVEAFEAYWCFDLFSKLNEPTPEILNSVCLKYFENIENKVRFRKASLLKRLLKFDLTVMRYDLRYKLISHLHEEPQIICCSVYYLQRFRELVKNDSEFFEFLDEFSKRCRHTHFHFTLNKFYEKERPELDRSPLISQIAVIRDERLRSLSLLVPQI